MNNNKQFNPRLYQGKDRVYSKVEKGISKCWQWDSDISEYMVKYFEARKKGITTTEIKKTFQDLKSARSWLYNTAVVALSNSDLFKDVVTSWKTQHLNSQRYGTKKYYESRLPYLEPLFNMPIDSISTTDVEKWIVWMKTKKFKGTRNSFEKELKCARAIFNFYKERSQKPFHSPLRDYHYKMSKISQKPLRSDTLTEEDFLKFKDLLLSDSKTQIYGKLAIVQYYHCLRISEAAAIYHEDIKMGDDARNNTLIIQRKVEWSRAKGDTSTVVNNFKNSKAIGVKSSVLHPEAKEALKDLYNPSLVGLVFQLNNQLLSYRSIQNAYDSAFRSLGLPYSSTHIIRKGGATKYFNEHGNVAMIQSQLGVTNMKTAQVYARPTQKSVDDHMASLYSDKADSDIKK